MTHSLPGNAPFEEVLGGRFFRSILPVARGRVRRIGNTRPSARLRQRRGLVVSALIAVVNACPACTSPKPSKLAPWTSTTGPS